MKTLRLTMAQALVKWLCAQRTVIADREAPLFGGVFAIFGHGNVTCLGEALEAVQDQLPTWRGQNEQSMSLAGVQSKLGVAVDAHGHICIPHDGAPSTHILKPDSERLFGGVQNEALSGSPVGQIVGLMNKVRPAKDIVYAIVEEWIETTQTMCASLEG